MTNPEIEPQAASSRPVGRNLARLGIVPAAIAAIYMSIPRDESGRQVHATVQADGSVTAVNGRGNQHRAAYRDSVGVLTICDGDTHNVRVGEVDTEEQCQERLDRQLAEHAAPLLRCTPILRRWDFHNQLSASINLAYNIGPGRPGHVGSHGFCNSSVARDFNAGRYPEACHAMRLFNRAGGRVLAGLDERRRRNEAECMIGFGPKRAR